MKTKEEVLATVEKWWDGNMVGNLILYRAPNSAGAESIIERVIKRREMKPETRAAFEMFMDNLGVERGEVARDSEGRPDRIKLTRRFDATD